MHLSEDNITVVERNEVSAAAVERAMVAIRRRQRNRALGRLTTDAAAQPIDEALLAVLDVVEEDNDAGVLVHDDVGRGPPRRRPAAGKQAHRQSGRPGPAQP